MLLGHVNFESRKVPVYGEKGDKEPITQTLAAFGLPETAFTPVAGAESTTTGSARKPQEDKDLMRSVSGRLDRIFGGGGRPSQEKLGLTPSEVEEKERKVRDELSK